MGSKIASFQFTHPGKGATSSRACAPSGRLRFNSRTLGRVRHSADKRQYRNYSSFNSRTLGRVRLSQRMTLSMSRTVSIHAPWEGCDTFFSTASLSGLRFQFTHPGKGATSLLYARSDQFLMFQFTHPGKGATLHNEERNRGGQFQFTHPGKGATLPKSDERAAPNVSIHAPWEGCD